MYKYNSKLQATSETTGTGTETKTGFCITKTPYEENVWHSMALNCEASCLIQLKFELHWNFMPVLVTSKFEEDLIENSIFFSSTQEHVTSKWLIRSGPNSNLSLLPVSLMETEFRVTEKRLIHHFLHYKSMGEKKISVQGHISPKWIIRSGPILNSFEL